MAQLGDDIKAFNKYVDTQVQDSQQAGPSTQNTSIPATKRKERPGPTSEELLQTIVQETRSKRHKSSEKAKKLLQKLLAGTPVKPHVRRAGQYLIGPKLGISPVKCIQHCLGRKDGTDRYYLLKILHLQSCAKILKTNVIALHTAALAYHCNMPKLLCLLC